MVSMNSLRMQHSPKAGVFNKLKKKLTKGRRYDIGSSGDDTDSIKLQKFEAMYARFPTQGDGGPKSRDSSPSIMDMESSKRSVLDSPQRANLSEKDINKTNTYTKDPTKEQKKNGSPTKEAKSNKGAGGPIVFINNTYDLPPILPVKKGAISDKRQRSKERHKDQASNKDGKKADADKQAVRNDNGEENKENSKVGSKSPHKSKSKGGSGGSRPRVDITAKGGTVSEDVVSASGCNSSGSSGDGKVKSREADTGQKDQEHLRHSVEAALKNLIKCEETKVSTNGANTSVDNRSPKIIPLFTEEKGVWGSEKENQDLLGSKSRQGDSSVVNGKINTEKNGNAAATNTAKGTANRAWHDNGFGNQRNSPGTIKKLDQQQQQLNVVNRDGKLLQPLKCDSSAAKPSVFSGKRQDSERQGDNAKEHKSDVGISQQQQQENGSDESIISERGKGNRGEKGLKNSSTDTSHAKLHDVPLFRPLSVAKIAAKREATEVIKSHTCSSNCQNLDNILADDDSEDDDMELGYTSLADVEKIFGSKKDAPTSAQEALLPTPQVKEGLQLKQSLFARDGNGNVMRGGPGCVIKCDVNVQGCELRPLLVDRLTSARFQGCHETDTTEAKVTEAATITEIEENEYGSIGDYSSRNILTKAKVIANNPNMGARPKQKTISRNTTSNKDSPIVKVTKEINRLPGFHGSSSPDIQKNFELNLNLEVERGISHESGYETGGSGLRSHSSSSNEFIQHDSSSYSLVSEPGEESPLPTGVASSKSPPVNLNDSTSSEETTDMRFKPEVCDVLGQSDNPALLASLYAFVPKGSQRANDASNVDSENADSDKSGSSEKTESQNRSSIQSPDSIKLEDTLIDDYDSDSYDDVDYGFEDGEEEDDDYLPPIPTRNYASEEKRLLEIKQCVETNSKTKPPMMTVIGSKGSKEEPDENPSIAEVKPGSTDKEPEPEVLDLSVKKTIKPVPEKSTMDSCNATVKPKSGFYVGNKMHGENTEIKSTSDAKTSKAVSSVIVHKTTSDTIQKKTKLNSETSSGIKSPIKAECTGQVSAASNRQRNLLKSTEFLMFKSEPGKASCSKNEHTVQSVIATLKTAQVDVHRNASYSPVRRKSYEKVERSTPIREIDDQVDTDPKSPVRTFRENRNGSAARTGRHRKDSENCSSKDGKDSRNEKSPDHVAGASQDKKNTKGSNTSLDSSKTNNKGELRKSVLDIKPDNKTGDSPSKSDELYNQSFSSDSTLSLDQPFWASFEEPVHMSMEEVMNQAKDLGIPLALPSGSPSKESSTESICSPTHRYNTQTLPCPRHGIITQDKLPKKKPGTLKDKFASLFTRKSGSSTSPKHSDPTRGTDSIQRRSLPAPPSSNDLDIVDGSNGSSSSPQKNAHHSSTRNTCEIHGSDFSRTLSPGLRRGGQTDGCCCKSSDSDHHTIGLGGRYKKKVSSSSCCPQHHHSSHRSQCVHECCHSSPCKNPKCQGHCLCEEGTSDRDFHCHHHSSGHQTMCTYPRHHSSSSRHRSSQVSPDKKHHQSHHHRERSHSRDVTMRSRSPNSHSLPSSMQTSGQHSYLSSLQPRQSRSSSSTGISRRCPPSPAPSTGTSSVLSAPSAFSFPPRNGMASPAHLRDFSPSRSSLNSQSTPSINLNGNADFIASLSKLKDVGWYWGPLSWDDAEAKLGNKPDGAFLVRDSSDDRYILSLSFRSQGTTHHTRIEHYKGMFSFYSQPKSHGAATIIEFIEKAMDHSRSGKFLYFLRPRAPGLPPAPVQLLYPVSRFQTMQTLQHLCRFSILKHVRRDHIDQLPVPQRIKDYLEMSQYYIEYLGEDIGFRQ